MVSYFKQGLGLVFLFIFYYKKKKEYVNNQRNGSILKSLFALYIETLTL